MKTARTFALAVTGIALAAAALAHNQSPAAAPPFDLGTISGSMYTNDSLGMTYEFPKGWFVDRAWMDEQNKPQDFGPRPADAQEAAKYDSMLAMRKGTHALLAVSEKPAETPALSGPRIQLSVSPVFENKSGSDILAGMKSMYANTRLIQVVADPADYTFGGQAFSRLDLRFLDVIVQGGAGFESSIIGARNSQYLQFAIFANSPEQLDQIVHSLDSLRFK